MVAGGVALRASRRNSRQASSTTFLGEPNYHLYVEIISIIIGEMFNSSNALACEILTVVLLAAPFPITRVVLEEASFSSDFRCSFRAD